MSNLVAFIKEMGPVELGETLRRIAFPGEGYGCYDTFDVREGAREWTREELKEFFCDDFDTVEIATGYTFEHLGLTIDVIWWWDGDGDLTFVVRQENKIVCQINNDDCKKSSTWVDI